MNLWIGLINLFIAWFLVLTIPGPNFIAVTQYSMSISRRSGVLIAFGVSTGAATWATASLIGVSVLFENAIWLYNLISIAGGIYLIFMGVKIISARVASAKKTTYKTQKTVGGHAAFRTGLFTSYSNPKTAAFFGSLFVMSFHLQAPGWFYVLTVCMVICASVIWYSLVACFFSVPHIQTTYQRFRKVVDKITGSIFVFLGLRLALTRA